MYSRTCLFFSIPVLMFCCVCGSIPDQLEYTFVQPDQLEYTFVQPDQLEYTFVQPDLLEYTFVQPDRLEYPGDEFISLFPAFVINNNSSKSTDSMENYKSRYRYAKYLNQK